MRTWCRLCDWRIEVSFAGPLPRGPGAAASVAAAGTGTPPGAGCIVAGAPHRSWVEPFLLLAAWPPDAARLAWIGEARTMTSSWWRRRLLPRFGAIPIVGGTTAPGRYAEIVAEALSSGAALAIFPEKGPPSPPDRTRTIAPGFAYLALRAGAPVIPVVIGGTHRVLRGSRFTVDVLEPIDVGEPLADPFTLDGRRRALELVERCSEAVAAILPGRTALADARRPRKERWRWLGTLLR
jgi:1-acyl-sn-glycerol-3-phosphate acyltransferase